MPTADRSSVIHSLRYDDAPAAIDWLCDALGFERNLVVPGEGNTIVHAQLTLGDGMIMLGSHPHEGEFGEVQKPPRFTGGRVTSSAYLVVDDPDAHYERAVAKGAKVIDPLEDKEHGGRGYTCRDPEGNVWSVGDYDPWAD
ncbi:MAG: VOC family protein [Myxococcota bacterium]